MTSKKGTAACQHKAVISQLCTTYGGKFAKNELVMKNGYVVRTLVKLGWLSAGFTYNEKMELEDENAEPEEDAGNLVKRRTGTKLSLIHI